jgi:hypothetical protein
MLPASMAPSRYLRKVVDRSRTAPENSCWPLSSIQYQLQSHSRLHKLPQLLPIQNLTLNQPPNLLRHTINSLILDKSRHVVHVPGSSEDVLLISPSEKRQWSVEINYNSGRGGEILRPLANLNERRLRFLPSSESALQRRKSSYNIGTPGLFRLRVFGGEKGDEEGVG